jgi:hypothetical protein
MDDTQRYLIDLKGYLVVCHALTAEHVAQLNDAVERHD